MLNVNVSAETERPLENLAAQNGQSVADFAGKILEEGLAENKLANGNESNQEREVTEDKENSLMKFVGLLSSKGEGKISQNYKKILNEEVDKIYGFGEE